VHVELLEEDCKSNTSIESIFKAFMKPLKFFSTTTPVGMPYRLCLLFPPTKSFKESNSLNSVTICNLAAQRLKKDEISIVELFPCVFCYAMLCYANTNTNTCCIFMFSWAGKRFCNQFKQPLFHKLLSWEPFLELVKLQVSACLELEDRAFRMRNHTGALSSIVFLDFFSFDRFLCH
jgi:hypothetical protein